ncbi:Ras-related protein Rab-40C [Dirofilaria immitis]|nr:Ras-related protein Rab-40C [Dirofilaria immitis]
MRKNLDWLGSRSSRDAFASSEVDEVFQSNAMRIAASELYREEHEYMFKFLLVGDSDVGKDEIANFLGPSVSFTPDAFFIPFAVPKTTKILLEGKFVRLQLWDASGQGRFSTIIKSYSRGVQGILLVYDITNRWSFDGIRRWLAEIDEHAPGVPRILIGNRLHLEFNRAVPRREAEYFARKRNMQYFEISTLAYFNVHESIAELARLVISRNRMHRLWKSSKAAVPVASLQDLCCRAIVKNILNVHAIDRLPIPSFLQLKVRSFASGADLCMRNVIRREYTTPYFNSASKYITRFVRPRNTKDHLRNANCDVM